MTSNIGQNYPYASETEEERVRRVETAIAAHPGLKEKIGSESVGLTAEDRWWVWKCPRAGCRGLLHSAGYAREAHAVYAVCDTCGVPALR